MLRLDAELNKDIILELKKPLGDLYSNFEDAINVIKSSKFLISVGDATFANLIKHEIYPDIAIIDNLIQRKNYIHNTIHTENILKANNPPGTITDNLWETIDRAIELSNKGDCYIIEVVGEEDLAVLPCILMSSEDTTILYGQPNEGLVVLNVFDMKDKAQKMIDAFVKE